MVHEKEIPAHIFRAYDIRGIFNVDLYPETILKIGSALGTYAKERGEESFVVGNDIRTSSPLLAHALISGLLSSGVNVTSVGTTSFGVCAFSGWLLKKDIIAYVTASHLPPEWNGVKLYTGEGIGFSADENEEIRDRVLEGKGEKVLWSKVGTYHEVDLRDEYVEYIAGRFGFESKRKKILLDCGNGSMGLVAPEIFRRTGIHTVSLFSDINPVFPKRPAEPTEENLTVLRKHLVEINKRSIENKVDFGVAFDGDGDRVALIDDKGRMLSAEQCGVILAKDLLEERKGTVLANVECSMLIERELEKLGGTIERIPVGHTFLTKEASKRNALLGIESSGHYVIPSVFPFDDAMIIPLKIAEIVVKTGKRLSELVDTLPMFPKERKNLHCDDAVKFDVIRVLSERLVNEYGADRVNTLDGIRIDLKEEGWVLIRASNTSPYIRVTVEGATEELKDRLLNKFVTITEHAIRG